MYTKENLAQLAEDIHKENVGWWEPTWPPTGQKEILMISEVAEAMEGLRKRLDDDKLPHRKMVEVEIADYVIRVLDYAGAYGLTLEVAEFEPEHYKQNEFQCMINMCSHAIGLSACEYKGDVQGMAYYTTQCVASAVLFCEKMGYDLWGAIEEKRAYNRERPDHKIENRLKKGGKLW